MRMNFTKDTGPKPSKSVMLEASTMVRADTGDHMAVAMSMRPNGATQAEIIKVLGKPHRNKIKSLLENRQLKKLILPDDTRSVRIKLVKRASNGARK